jgi:hypothetical protein
METRVAKMPEAQRRNVELARPVQTIAASKASPLKFEQINADARQKIGKQASDVHKFRDERVKWEATGETNPKAVRPPAERTITPPAEARGPVAPPAGRNEPVAPLVEPKGPVTPSVEHKEPVKPAAEHAPGFVPPHSVPLTKPERVKIPVAPPIMGKPGAKSGDVEKGPPPRPINEQKFKAEAPPKAEAKAPPKAEVKDKEPSKDAGDPKGK